MKIDLSEIVTTTQAAEILRVPVSTVRRWFGQGRFKRAVLISDTWVVPRADLLKFVRPRPGRKPHGKAA